METSAIFIGVIISLIQLVKALFDRNFREAVIIVVVAIAGALLAPEFNYSWVTGMYLALTGSAVIVVAKRVGNG